ncbi:hypothetical protein Acsp01_46910 [Actinoplanes sp. NBRC 101535]|nr:hypothetical protein Acsp01_46910 [Actinoplanes sp. NBRC 101535]
MNHPGQGSVPHDVQPTDLADGQQHPDEQNDEDNSRKKSPGTPPEAPDESAAVTGTPVDEGAVVDGPAEESTENDEPVAQAGEPAETVDEPSAEARESAEPATVAESVVVAEPAEPVEAAEPARVTTPVEIKSLPEMAAATEVAVLDEAPAADGSEGAAEKGGAAAEVSDTNGRASDEDQGSGPRVQEEEEDAETPGVTDAGPARRPGLLRRIFGLRVASVGFTVLAAGVLFVALLWPNVLKRLTLGNFARIPIEAAIALLVLIFLPRRVRVVVGTLLGVMLGWLVVEKSLDMGFFETLARPFDPVLDWVLFDDAYGFVRDSYGQASAYGAAAGIVLLPLVVIVLCVWALLRLAAVGARHRRGTAAAMGTVTLAWALTLTLGVQFFDSIPVAARSSATYAYDRAWQARAGIANEAEFAKEVNVDAFGGVPADQLLTGLKGKDFVLTFVESYGRNAVEAPEMAPGVDAVLDGGTQKLEQAGFAARSGWLTSPTFGGNSWLAHSTLMSGLWINNQGRYRNLTASNRLTLASAFKKASWDTVSVMPGATRAWPEGGFYGFNRVWDSRNLGYQGPKFSWAQMPDQYTLKQLAEREYTKPGRQPLMVEMPLISSHTPWAPVPTYLEDWDQVGDGSVYADQVANGTRKADIWSSTSKVRREYGRSIEYTLTSLINWVEKYGDDNLVMVFLGDHQPSSVVAGQDASHDVPITILAKDPAVLDKIADWNWSEGLRPATDAPVWPMSDFRDRFLTAYGSKH